MSSSFVFYRGPGHEHAGTACSRASLAAQAIQCQVHFNPAGRLFPLFLFRSNSHSPTTSALSAKETLWLREHYGYESSVQERLAVVNDFMDPTRLAVLSSSPSSAETGLACNRKCLSSRSVGPSAAPREFNVAQEGKFEARWAIKVRSRLAMPLGPVD